MLDFLRRHPADAVFGPDVLDILGAALDEAWKSVEASGATYESEIERSAARDVLARRIIDLAKLGERDQHRLSRDAVTHLAQCIASRT